MTKTSRPVRDGSRITVDIDGPQWVSRGAGKLLGALSAFGPQGLTFGGRRCLDLGACTGGFTQVLLHHGADHVVALDVGTGQLAPELAAETRVTDLSGTSARGLRPDDIGGPVDLVVADLSFISLTLVLPTIAGLLRPAGEAVVLVKPQFEVGRAGLGKRGVVRRASERARALRGVMDAAEAAGLHPGDLVRSPVKGGEGNTEYLLWMGVETGDGPSWQALGQRAEELAQDGGGGDDR